MIKKSGIQFLTYLLFMWSGFKNILNIAPHIKLFQHLITLIQNKVLDVLQVQLSSSNQSQNPTWSSNNDVWRVFSQSFPVILNWHTTKENSDLDVVQVLRKSFVFF